jgi:hypothetical protein
MARLDRSPIGRLIVTDSIETQPVELSAKVAVVSVAPLFAEVISRIHRRESISVLFQERGQGAGAQAVSTRVAVKRSTRYPSRAARRTTRCKGSGSRLMRDPNPALRLGPGTQPSRPPARHR